MKTLLVLLTVSLSIAAQDKIDCRNICADQKAGAIQQETCHPKPKPCRKRRKVTVAQFIRDNMPQDTCVEITYTK